VIKKLVQFGKKKYNLETPEEVLHKLHVGESRCATDIAKMFEESPTFVRLCMEEFGISMGFNPRIFKGAKKKGFRTLGEFFSARGRETFSAMAAELGVSESVVRNYYEEWVRVRGECHVGK